MHSALYDELRDFAGPVAMVLAAVVAAWIAACFVRQQAAATQQQADVALDQLRLQAFDRRYRIFENTADLLRLLLNKGLDPDFHPIQAMSRIVDMQEGRLFYSPALMGWLGRVEADCHAFFEARASGDPQRQYETQKVLLEDLRGLPERFGPELSLPKLTEPPGRL